MARINRNFVFLGVAVLLGIAASLMAVRYINSEVATRTQQALPPPEHTRTVVVPVKDLPKGATLTQADVATREAPVDFIPADALTPDNYATYMGQVLSAPLTHGAPIPASAVELVAEHFSNIISATDVAYSMQVDETNSVSGLIVPGDHIDILLLTNDNQAADIRPLLGNVLVLATGKHAKGVQGDDKDGNGSYSNITLELSPRDAQRIGMAMKVGELRVLLRPPGSDQPFDLNLLSKQDLLRLGRRVKNGGVEFIIGNV
jgi:pilus assembly protein CpaB